MSSPCYTPIQTYFYDTSRVSPIENMVSPLQRFCLHPLLTAPTWNYKEDPLSSFHNEMQTCAVSKEMEEMYVYKKGMPESSDTDKLIEILLILFLPPLAVWYHNRACSCQVCLNIILLLFFVLPAVIHAMWYCYMRK